MLTRQYVYVILTVEANEGAFAPSPLGYATGLFTFFLRQLKYWSNIYTVFQKNVTLFILLR